MDPGENLVFGHWPEPVMTMLYHRFLHEGIIEVKFPTPPNTSGGNPKSVDRMTATFMCRHSLGGGILGDAPRARGTSGWLFRWSCVSFYIFMAAVLGGMEQRSRGVKCVAMDM